MNSHSQQQTVSQDLRQQLRKGYRAKRQALTELQQRESSQQFFEMTLSQGLLDGKSKIALYLPNDGEIDPIPLIQYTWVNEKQVYLPVLHPFNKKSLLFMEYLPTSEMHNNRFGIPEPKIECHRLGTIQSLDIIFTPLVAFDKIGNRMGMGGGFYDRTLACLTPNIEEADPPRVIGLAHDCQECPNIPVSSWDIPLNSILTPTRLLHCHT